MNFMHKFGISAGIFYTALFIASICQLLFWSLPATAQTSALADSPPVEMKEGWSYRWGDSPTDGKGIPLWAQEGYPGWQSMKFPGQPPSKNEKEFLWLQVKLPDGRWENPCLYITKVYQTFEVYQDKQMIYKYGSLAPDDTGQYGGFFPWHIIPVKNYSMDGTITIRIHSDDKNKIGISRNVTIGSQSDIYKKMLKDGMARFVIGCILIFLGLFAIIIYANNPRESIYLVFGATSLAGGAFVICLSRINQFFIQDPLFWSYIMVISLFPRPALEFLLIEKLFDHGNKIVARLWQGHLALAMLLFAWTFTNPANLIPSLRIFEFIHIAATLIQIVVIARLLFKSIDGKIFATGYTLMVLTGLYDILLDLGIVNVTGYVSHWGDLFHLAAIALILVRRITDINARAKKFYQELIIKSKDLENKNLELSKMDRLKDEFLANTSHELRTPINGIIGIADSIISGAAGRLNQRQVKNLLLIVSSGKRLLNLINDILDFARLKNGDIELHKKPTDIRQISELVIGLARPQAAVKNLNLINKTGDITPLVYADETRLEQIMHNLIGNAVKFTDSGTVTVSALQKGEKLEITVSDTGMGITPDKLQSIFTSFQQVDSSISRIYGGTGLGLSISRHLVEMHGGKIYAESTPGKGSKFIFTLPMLSKEMQEQRHTSSAPLIEAQRETYDENFHIPNEIKPDSEYKILVADDEAVNLQVLINYLSMEKYSVVRALNGKEALELIEANEFDLVILDIIMPRISGLEVCSILRKRYSLFEMPVIMLTAKNHPSDVVAGFEAGANDYLSKPFDKRELLARVHTLLVLKQSARQAVLNSQRLEAEWQQRQLAEAINGLTMKLTATLEPNEVLYRLLESLRKITGYDSALVMLSEDNRLKMVSTSGHYCYEGRPDPYTRPENIQLLKNVVDGNQPVIIGDVQSDTDFKDFGLSERVKSWMGVPVMRGNRPSGIIILHHHSPHTYTEVDARAVLSFAGQAGIAIDNARLFAEVKSLAITDYLTGLYNRRYFFEFADHEYQRSRRYGTPLSLVMLDIDNFKRINDTYGHLTGDEILKSVARRCLETMRDADIVGRYGGEEFVILLPDTGPQDAEAAAERLRQRFEEEPFAAGNQSIPVTVSLGVCTLSEGIQSMASMLGKVDEAVYNAKKSGRNSVVVST